jgi:Fe-S cluster assembly protein SufB
MPVVELVALTMLKSNIRYKTGIQETKKVKVAFSFVTKEESVRKCKISWTQVETGSAVTWKYPSVILKGDNSVGEFYSLLLPIIFNRLTPEQNDSFR